jgi:glutamate-1-semialdehyde 2,1-aminomutase
MLDHLADGAPQAHAEQIANALRENITKLMRAKGIAGVCYGESSTWHLYFGEEFDGTREVPAAVLRGFDPARAAALGRALNARGVDPMSAMSGVTSAAHTMADVDETLSAFEAAFETLAADGYFG